MKIKNLPKICGTEEVRIYQGNKVVAETWVNGASLTHFVEKNLFLREYADREVDYIEICAEGCLNETLVMEIYLK